MLAFMGYTNDFSSFKRAIYSVHPFWNDLIVIDNSQGKEASKFCDENGIRCVENFSPISCTQMFNTMQELARKNNQNVFITMHSDIFIPNPTEFQSHVMNHIQSVKNDRKWGVTLTMHDSFAIWNRDAVDVVGPWDEYIDQYPCDTDYLKRIRLYKFKVLNILGDKIQHIHSSTIQKNHQKSYINNIFNVARNRDYFELKWNGEQNTVPFNGSDIDNIYGKIINGELYSQLYHAYETNEGAFLQDTNRNTRIAQFTFVMNLIKAIKPKRILETGTHKSFFAYFLSFLLDSFELTTFDMNPQSSIGVGLLNSNLQNVNIQFINGNTIETLTNFYDNQFDMAYVDGGHDFDPAYSDFKNVMRLGIPDIIADDFKLKSVQDALNKALSEYPNYYMLENPLNDLDCRGMVLIRKTRTEK